MTELTQLNILVDLHSTVRFILNNQVYIKSTILIQHNINHFLGSYSMFNIIHSSCQKSYLIKLWFRSINPSLRWKTTQITENMMPKVIHILWEKCSLLILANPVYLNIISNWFDVILNYSMLLKLYWHIWS